MDQPQPPPEIAFFDVETTIPSRPGAGYSLLEFGAILVCPRRLVELGSYSTLISPSDPAFISAASVRCNGITKDTVANAPSFRGVSEQIFSILHGRVWAGHNIGRFDCARIREAFAEIGRPAPEAKGMIDTLPLLTQRFGRRAGDMKMASLGTYFGLGQQKHRSLDDVRMNFEVLKYCASVLFLESSLPNLFSANGLVCENTTLRSQDNGIASPSGANPNLRSAERKAVVGIHAWINQDNGIPSPGGANLNLSSASDLPSNQHMDHEGIVRVHAQAEATEPRTPLPDHDASDLVAPIEQMNLDPSQRNDTVEGSPAVQSPETCAPIVASESSSGCTGFLEPGEVSVDCISASQVPFHYYGNRILVLHRDVPLQICCSGIRVQFGISAKFFDHAGRPKLNIVVNVPANLCQVLDACDRVAQKSSLDSGSSSEWRPVVKKNGYSNSSSIRLHIPSIANGDVATYATEIFKKDPSGDNQKLVFNQLDTAVLEQLFVPGTIIDSYFSVDIYDFQQYAGIRLVAKRLVIHSL